MQRAFARVQGSPSSRAVDDQQGPRDQTQQDVQTRTSPSSNWVNSAETLAAAGRESYPEQLRNLRAMARGPEDDVQGNLSGDTLTERREQRARAEDDGTPEPDAAANRQGRQQRGNQNAGAFFFMAL